MTEISAAPRPMDVKEALKRAFHETRDRMFRPFLPMAWIAIGIFAFFENAAQGPAGFSYAISSDVRSIVTTWFPLSEDLIAVSTLIMDQSGLFVLVSLPLLFFFFFVTIFLLWLGSHFQMAFLRAAVTRSYGIRKNWIETSEDGHSLFLFRLALAVVSFISLFSLILVASLFVQDSPPRFTRSGLPLAFGPVEAFLAWGGFFMGLVNEVLRNICAPIMLRLHVTCLDSFRFMIVLVRRYPLQFAAVVGVRLLWLGLMWILWIVGGFGTCLIGFLPGVHHALFAPCYLFDRLFSYYLIESVWPGGEDGEATGSSPWSVMTPRPRNAAE